MPPCTLLQPETQALVAWAKQTLTDAFSEFEAYRTLATRLGTHHKGGVTEVGFWAPEIAELHLPADSLLLEIFTPLNPLDLTQGEQTVSFRRERLPLHAEGDFYWGVLEGMRAGDRDSVGSFYRATYQDSSGVWQVVPDYLAYSIPYGAFAPAELYDVAGMLANRRDAEHFATLATEPDPDGVPRITPPVNILQVHAPTASDAGTLAGLNRIYQGIAAKLSANEPLSPTEENFAGYDAVQLMPIEPIIEYETGLNFWDVARDKGDTVEVRLCRPDMTNWGYDVVISAASATNPVLLESGRPHELLDLIETLHAFPGKPIQLLLDVVYGHTDNQALSLLHHTFLASAGMYGQNMAFRQPVVRAIMLEMQRRKSDYGVDGLRVDGAQDFKYWDAEAGELFYDDDYLRLMNDVVQEVAGVHYRPFMIFEDGRPWPRPDWELASTYREITEQMPNVFQWGPLTFAHNTPFLFTFWLTKWWRVREIAEVGATWITGCANHDTLRRGTQVDIEARINHYLGNTLPEILRNAYDNPAAKLFDYAMMPGLPMDFINATMRAPWSFVRNTDERYGVKVVAEEARFLHWAVDKASFSADDAFIRLKNLGFETLEGLRRFLYALEYTVKLTDYDLKEIVKVLGGLEPPLEGPDLSVPSLKMTARAWMDDLHDYCQITRYSDRLEPKRTAFNLKLREFRRERPWLMANLGDGEYLDYRHPSDKSVVYYGLRRAPDKGEVLLFVANMEGEPATLVPAELPVPGKPEGGWQLALATPGVEVESFESPLTLYDSQGAVFVLS